MSLNLGELTAFAARCERLGVPAPASIARAVELLGVVENHQQTPARDLLTMTDDEARAHIEEISIRKHTASGFNIGEVGLEPGISAFRSQLTAEVRESSLPELEELIRSMQPRFEEAAAPLVVAAQQYGFTSATTSDQVIELADEDASAAWRGARRAWSAIAPLVTFRIEVSRVFEVSPTREETQRAIFPRVLGGMPLNYSSAFAAGDNWSLENGYYEGKTIGHLDWLALAAGGLQLNTPQQTADKIAQRKPRPLAALLSSANQDDDAPRPAKR